MLIFEVNKRLSFPKHLYFFKNLKLLAEIVWNIILNNDKYCFMQYKLKLFTVNFGESF